MKLEHGIHNSLALTLKAHYSFMDPCPKSKPGKIVFILLTPKYSKFSKFAEIRIPARCVSRSVQLWMIIVTTNAADNIHVQLGLTEEKTPFAIVII